MSAELRRPLLAAANADNDNADDYHYGNENGGIVSRSRSTTPPPPPPPLPTVISVPSQQPPTTTPARATAAALRSKRELQAIVFTEDALAGRSIDHLADVVSLRLYRRYYTTAVQGFLVFIICVNLFLAFFEEPTDCPVPRVALHLIEAFTLLVLLGDAGCKLRMFGRARFWKDPWLLVYAGAIVFSLIDLFADSLSSHDHIVHVRRLIRPFFLAQRSTLMKKTLKNIGKSIPEVLNVLALLLLHLVMFTLLGRLIFWDGPEARDYFEDLVQAFLSLMVLLTTSNHPDVMMPAYRQSQWYVLFFISFLAIGLFCLMNLLTAIIYNQFRGYLAGSMQTTHFRRRVGLRAAFAILRSIEQSEAPPAAVTAPESSAGLSASRRPSVAKLRFESDGAAASNSAMVVSTDSVRALIERLRLSTRVKLGLLLSLDRRDNDPNEHNSVSLLELYALFEPQVLGLWERSKLPRRTTAAEARAATFRTANPHSLSSRWAAFMVGLRARCDKLVGISWYRYISVALVLLNLVSIGVQLSDNLYRTESYLILFRGIGLMFVFLSLAEISIRILARGLGEFWSDSRWNQLDTVTIVALVVVMASNLIAYPIWSPLSDGTADLATAWQWIRARDSLFVLRTLLLIRDVRGRLRLIAATIAHLVTSLATFTGVLVILYYNFASIGVEVFAGTIQHNDTRLNGTAFAEAGYWLNSFDNFHEALVTLWELALVNNWFIIMDAHAAVTSPWARLYFIAWYLVSVILAMNLFIALLIETFIIKWSSSVLAIKSAQQLLHDEAEMRAELDSDALNVVDSASVVAGYDTSRRRQQSQQSQQQQQYQQRSRTVTELSDVVQNGDGVSYRRPRTVTTNSISTLDDELDIQAVDERVLAEARSVQSGGLGRAASISSGSNRPRRHVRQDSLVRPTTESVNQARASIVRTQSFRSLFGAREQADAAHPPDTRGRRGTIENHATSPLDDLFRSNLQEPDDDDVLDAVLGHAELDYLLKGDQD